MAEAEDDIWQPPPRYTRRPGARGHRAPVDGRAPAESKRLPWWTWPFEYLWRLEAWLMRNQPERVRTGLEEGDR